MGRRDAPFPAAGGNKEGFGLGLRDVPDPFWADLPYANIFNCIVPDLLHQLHKGVFMTHLVSWVSQGHEAELDARFARVPPYPDLRVFKNGISTISQWTGNEYRQMEKVFIGLLPGLHDDPRVVAAARAILDFIYLAHYPSHTAATLRQMQDALDRFHSSKQVFVTMGIRDHFNVQKLHWMQHYLTSIIDFGTCDGLSTDISERLHIDCVKMAYRASNRKEYVKQMLAWLSRREKMRWLSNYISWSERRSHSDAAGAPSRGTRMQTSQAPPESLENPPVQEQPERPVADSTSSALSACISAAPTISQSPPQTCEDSDNDAEDRLFPSYRIASKPAAVLTGNEIMVAYQADSFPEALGNFLQAETGLSMLPEMLLHHNYATYVRFARTLPSLRGLPEESLKDTVHARPSIGSKPSRFSTVLFVENPGVAETLGVEGYRVAQVRVIFTLPPSLQRFVFGTLRDQPHLAYVELFTPFTSPDPHSRMYKIGRSLTAQCRFLSMAPSTTDTGAAFHVHSCHVHVSKEETKATLVIEPQKPGPVTIVLAVLHRATAPPPPESPPWPGRPYPEAREHSVMLSGISAASVQEESETESELDEERRKPFPTDPEPPADDREPFTTPQSVRAQRNSPPTRKRKPHEGGIPPAYDAIDPTLRFASKRRRC
ncbi:hypothetical protein NUW54_g6465 [Trametes sanguinea]|uniref:Uncharacterized protein n=1 Tax=Trametes sanguinea TaxID=158606 RepID=A0ACC1PS56_9APHY|nr:hypothetical protein NUW54_g6465 [Trametes sanguinea]